MIGNNYLKHLPLVRGRIRKGRKPYYVFIDEIQRSVKVPAPGMDISALAPEDREDALVTFYDVLNGWKKIENADVYVTGSNSKTLSSDIATNFRDRGQQLRVWPLSFAEWLPASGLSDKMEAFHRYLTWGGMPVARIVFTIFFMEYSSFLVARYRRKGNLECRGGESLRRSCRDDPS